MATARIAVVTGANQGIGYATVRRLCKENPTWCVYGTSRSPANGEEACTHLKEEGCTNVQFLTADITNESTIIALKEHLVKEHGGLDVLVNNAGFAFKKAATEPGSVQAEVTLRTNVFGTECVLRHLMPILRDGARVVVLSSMVAPMALHKVKKLAPERYDTYIKNEPPLPLDQVLQDMRDYVAAMKDGTYESKGWADGCAYSNSKMGDTLMTRAIAYELSKTPERDIVINSADPGYVNTNMSSYQGPLTIDQGADTPYYLATLPPKTEINGQHVADRAIVPWK